MDEKNDVNIKYGVAGMKGQRPSMEDEHIIETFEIENKGKYTLFGVFDGHGGRNASLFCKNNIIKYLIMELKESNDMEQILINVFHGLDDEFIARSRGDPSGSTAVIALITHKINTIHIAHCGDSRAFFSKKEDNSEIYVETVTEDHKPTNDKERDRIRNAGGYIIFNRVMGELAVSRAIGDAQFKEPTKLVLSTPEIYEKEIDANEIMVLACDGLFEVMNDEDASSWIYNYLSKHDHKNNLDFNELAQNLANECVNKLHSRDNVTVMIVSFYK